MRVLVPWDEYQYIRLLIHSMHKASHKYSCTFLQGLMRTSSFLNLLIEDRGSHHMGDRSRSVGWVLRCHGSSLRVCNNNNLASLGNRGQMVVPKTTSVLPDPCASSKLQANVKRRELQNIRGYTFAEVGHLLNITFTYMQETLYQRVVSIECSARRWRCSTVQTSRV